MIIKDWKKCFKALSVVLPTLASFMLLIVSVLQNMQEANLIPAQYIPIITAVVIPVLAFLGRIIPQNLQIDNKPFGEKDE